MTIDERIEALTQSVELLSHMHQDFVKHMEEYTAKTDSLLTLLTKAVANHEHRLDDLEDSEGSEE